jgi:diguanylate cyclase (GGDEF)-like protein
MRVLVADDDATTRLVVRALVQELGHECLVAEDGDRAWALLQESEIDVLVSGRMMPGLDGHELCRRIRARTTDRYTYIILAAAMGDRDDVLAGMEAGADDYLIQPLDAFAVRTRLIAAERVTALHHQLGTFRVELDQLNDELAEQARTDPLTQLGNRRRLQEDLVMLHARARRHHRTYSIAMCDLDFFKAYNETYGHAAGDEALQQVAAVLTADLRTEDRAYRYGGEEFVLVISESSFPGAVLTAERIRGSVQELALAHSGNRPPGVVTISVGVATFDPKTDVPANTVLELAGKALYLAKQHGRNRVAAPNAPNLAASFRNEKTYDSTNPS